MPRLTDGWNKQQRKARFDDSRRVRCGYEIGRHDEAGPTDTNGDQKKHFRWPHRTRQQNKKYIKKATDCRKDKWKINNELQHAVFPCDVTDDISKNRRASCSRE